MENNERVSIILLSMVLFTWFTTLLKLPMNQKPASPRYAYDGLSDDKRRRQQNDDELPNNEERLRDNEWNALYDVTPPNDDGHAEACNGPAAEGSADADGPRAPMPLQERITSRPAKVPFNCVNRSAKLYWGFLGGYRAII
jgi:hypothetical protein